MSGEALYERYKDALKRGHVASLRGRLEEALTAYAEAAAIAPERATPHTSAGTALMRRRRPADALRHYDVALGFAPRDEAALLGRAQALAALDRRGEAADTFDALAEVRAGTGKLADAVDAARRGLELAEGRERRRMLERLIAELRSSEPGEPGRLALERALVVLEGVAMVAPAGTRRDEAVAPPAPAGAEVVPPALDEPVVADVHEAQAAPDAVEAAEPVADLAEREATAPEEPARVRAALDRDLPDDLDLVGLARTVEEDELGRQAPEAFEHVLDLVAGYRRAGQLDAALDTCYLALSRDPDSIGLHLALVELYDERGWATLAGEKLDLLDRLAVLDQDRAAGERVAAARAVRG